MTQTHNLKHKTPATCKAFVELLNESVFSGLVLMRNSKHDQNIRFARRILSFPWEYIEKYACCEQIYKLDNRFFNVVMSFCYLILTLTASNQIT